VGDVPGHDEIAGEPLPDEAIVVRYGEMKDQDLTVSVWVEHDDSGRWGLSILCGANLATRTSASRWTRIRTCCRNYSVRLRMLWIGRLAL
jgi:hypothetical protein